jgi:hypothetical protein
MAAVDAVARSWVADLWPAAPLLESPGDCPVPGWAASGGMALTGPADGPPDPSPAPAFALLEAVVALLAAVTAEVGVPVAARPAQIVAARAGLRGLRRSGRRSAGGATRLLRAADGWCAVTLSRPSDFEAVPAVLGRGYAGDPWQALEAAAARMPAAELVERAQLLGVPAAPLPPAPAPTRPWVTRTLAAPTATRSLRGLLVVDLSSLWAGPLCAHLLGRAGARVVKIEAADRPDGARRGDPALFELLHAGHQTRSLDFRSETGRAALRDLLDRADVVIEASRPRALAQLGLAPEQLPPRAGRVWLSLSGYGRREPMRVAFGDDAAVAGGLVGRHNGEPVFCADAIADPLSGTCAALAVSCAVAAGGGVLLDLSMRDTAAAFAAAPALAHGPHRVRAEHAGWQVDCLHDGSSRPVLPPRAAPEARC